MKINDILAFNKERYFNGAIQAEWFYDSHLSYEIGSSYVFHGPRYYGVSNQDVQAGEHKLMDTVSFTSMISDRVTGRNSNGFVMTIAGYGTGKSHLAVTLGKLFSGDDERTRETILNNICDIEPRIGQTLRQDVQPSRNLVIILNGMNNFNLDHEVMKCAKKALEQHGINPDVMKELATAYATAQHFLQQTFDMLCARYIYYAQKAGLHANDQEKLKKYLISYIETNSVAFGVINSVYRELNGQDIQWDSGISAGEVLTFLSKRFIEEKHVFDRVIVLFDEFGRYIEYAAQNPNIAGDSALQQIFEAVQNGKGKILHIAFIQSELSAYLSRIEKTSNISRYVGRYDTSDKYYLSSNFETILANLILKKDESLFRQIVVSSFNRTQRFYQNIMMALNRWVKASANKSVWSNEDMFMNVICKGCYPLHPITVWMLANMSNWMQQRSTITFASEMFEKISDRYISTDSDFLPTIRPADIIESQVLNEMINSEEKGLVQSQYCLLYRDIITKLGDTLSRDERTVLNAVLITNIGRFEAANKEDAVLAVRYCACLSADAVKRCLASLENTHGVISYNDASHRFAMYAEANGRNDYKRVFLRHLISVYKKVSIDTIDETISNAWALRQDVETAFARLHGISGYEWRFEKRLIDLDDFSGSASSYCSQVESAYDGEQARGLLILLYTNREIKAVEVEVARVYRQFRYNNKPIVVMMLSDPEKTVLDHLANYRVIQSMSLDEKQRFARFIEEDRIATTSKLVQSFEGMLMQRMMVCDTGIVQSNKRLNQICLDRFEACFTQALPYNFDGFEKRLTPTIRRYYNEMAGNLANGVLNKRGSYDLLQQDIKNRIRGLFSDSVARSWRMLSEELLYHMPSDERVADFFVSTKAKIDDQQKHSLNELFAGYVLSPYGMNQYSLSMLIVAFLSFYESSVSVYNSSERISIPQLVQTVFTSNKLQFTTLMRLSISAISESSRDAIHQLCITVKANRYVENCQEFSNSLEQMIQASGTNTSMEGNIASARMRIKEGLKIYKEIYGNLKDAQTNAGELKSKFSFVKAAQVYIKLADYEGEIGENSGYYYSKEYQQACEACIRLTETALRDVGTDAVEKLRCDITQLSQYKNTYKRVVDVLKRKGFASLSIQIQDRLVQIEKDLVTTQKYKQSIDDVNYFISTTKINSTSNRAECLKAKDGADNWIQYWSGEDDFSAEKRENYLAKLRDIVAACDKRLFDMDAQYHALIEAETNTATEADLSQMEKMIARLETFGLSEQQEPRVAEIKEAIRTYAEYWEDKVITRENYDEALSEARQIFARAPYIALAMARFEKIDQQIRREAKAWMQKNVLGYARKIYNLPVVEAIRLQGMLEKVPDCLDADDLETVEEYRALVAERIKLARVEAIELMFKELDLDEKNRCLDDLKKIMDKGLKRAASGKGTLKSPRFTDEELILLMYCYMKYRQEWFSAKSLHVNELSRLYRDLPIHSMEERLAPTFRNPAGIDLQIRSFAKCDPEDNHRQKLVPSLDMTRIWEEYSEDLRKLEERIGEIVFKYGINTKDYPTLFL